MKATFLTTRDETALIEPDAELAASVKIITLTKFDLFMAEHHRCSAAALQALAKATRERTDIGEFERNGIARTLMLQAENEQNIAAEFETVRVAI